MGHYKPSNSWGNILGLIYAPTSQKGTRREQNCDDHGYNLINCTHTFSNYAGKPGDVVLLGVSMRV